MNLILVLGGALTIRVALESASLLLGCAPNEKQNWKSFNSLTSNHFATTPNVI